MTKTFCYEEFCGVGDKVHIRTLIVFGLVVAVVITLLLVTNSALTGTEMLNVPLYPVDY